MEYGMTEKKKSTETTVKNILRRTRMKYSAEEKIQVVIARLRGDSTIAELRRREGINQNPYYTEQGFPGGRKATTSKG